MAMRAATARANRPQRKQRPVKVTPAHKRIVWRDDTDEWEGVIVNRQSHHQFKVRKPNGMIVYIDRRYVTILPQDHTPVKAKAFHLSAETIATRNADRVRAYKYAAERSQLHLAARYGGVNVNQSLEQFGQDTAARFEAQINA